MVSTSNGSNNRDTKYIDHKGSFFISSIAGLSIIGGFSYALSLAKKSDPTSFFQGAAQSHGKASLESGSRLALRALGYGSLISVAGVGFISGVAWLISGATNHSEFREFAGRIIPPIKRKNPERGREDFASLKELADYLTEEDKKVAERNINNKS